MKNHQTKRARKIRLSQRLMFKNLNHAAQDALKARERSRGKPHRPPRGFDPDDERQYIFSLIID
ncbi:MAG: hypothetical protein WC471_03170 [Candidatus Woesearchaeota archaeon]